MSFWLSKALLFPLPKTTRGCFARFWDYHTPSWVPPSIGSPSAWSCELTWFQVPLLLCAAVQAQPLLSVWHSPKYRVRYDAFPCVRWRASLCITIPQESKAAYEKTGGRKTRRRGKYCTLAYIAYVCPPVSCAKLMFILVTSKDFVLINFNLALI